MRVRLPLPAPGFPRLTDADCACFRDRDRADVKKGWIVTMGRSAVVPAFAGCVLCICAVIGEGAVPESSLKSPPAGFLQEIRTTEGSVLFGRITACGADTAYIETEFGGAHIPINRIEQIRLIPEAQFGSGRSRHPGPNATRLLFAPTGRMLTRGEGYFADYYVFFPSLNYGVTDNISLGGGLSIFPSGSMKDQIYFFTPKVAVRKSARTNIAAGAMILRVPFDDDVPTLSLFYGVGTFGSSDRSVTVGAGYGMANRNITDRPVIVLGGEYRTGRRTSLVTENWIVPGVEHAVVSLGVRFFGEDLSADFALFGALGSGSNPVIPYVDFLWRF